MPRTAKTHQRACWSTPHSHTDSKQKPNQVGRVNRPFGRVIAKSSASLTDEFAMRRPPSAPQVVLGFATAAMIVAAITRALYIAQQHQTVAAARDEWRNSRHTSSARQRHGVRSMAAHRCEMSLFCPAMFRWVSEPAEGVLLCEKSRIKRD